jgi:hypothetical protein
MACEDSEEFSRLRLAYKKSRCSQLLSRFGRLIPKNRSRIRLQRVSEGAGRPHIALFESVCSLRFLGQTVASIFFITQSRSDRLVGPHLPFSQVLYIREEPGTQRYNVGTDTPKLCATLACRCSAFQ